MVAPTQTVISNNGKSKRLVPLDPASANEGRFFHLNGKDPLMVFAGDFYVEPDAYRKRDSSDTLEFFTRPTEPVIALVEDR